MLDVNCIEGLPDYSKIFYTTCLNIFSEFDDEIVKKGCYYDASYYRKEVCLTDFMK